MYLTLAEQNGQTFGGRGPEKRPRRGPPSERSRRGPGPLDSRAGAEVMATFTELHAAGHTIILVTHDPNVASRAERIIEMADGRVAA